MLNKYDGGATVVAVVAAVAVAEKFGFNPISNTLVALVFSKTNLSKYNFASLGSTLNPTSVLPMLISKRRS